MRILFVTSNKGKVSEARKLLADLRHTVEQLLVGGLAPKFNEPKDLGIEAVANSKMVQALNLLEQEGIEGVAVMVEDSGSFSMLLMSGPVPSLLKSRTKLGSRILSLLKEDMSRGQNIER